MTTTTITRPAEARGRTELGWLHSKHTFSFGEYFDPDQMGYKTLRVINDDIVEPGQGFGTHPHRDTEIFSYVIDGELAHRDSMGNGSVIEAGNLQYMSAGSGVYHSEFNPSPDKRVHFLQIWLRPNERGGEPRYAELQLGDRAEPNALTLLFSGQPQPGAIHIRQDADVYFGRLDAGRTLDYQAPPQSGIYIHVIQGELTVDGLALGPGDGTSIESSALALTAGKDAQFLLFSLR